APYTSADAELTAESLAAARTAIASGAGLSPADRKRAEAMLAALPTGRSAQMCTLSVLPSEPPSLGKSSLVSVAPSVAIAAAGGDAGTPVALAGNEVRLTKLRAPGAAFELRFADPAKAGTPVATLSVPSHWGGMYLIDKFKGQPTHAGDRRVWDV